MTGFQTRAVGGARRADRDRRRRARAGGRRGDRHDGLPPRPVVLGELRLDLDDRVEAPRALAPLIDPNLHSCGTVPPHGVDELSHPDAGVYVVGMKSYGRAPTFLLRTGYEQVRSVVAALDGDWQAARTIDFVLPETGVCGVSEPGAGAGRAAAPARHTRRSRRRRERRHRRHRPRGSGRGRSSVRSRSPTPSPGGSSTTPSRSSCSPCSASSASRPPSSPAPISLALLSPPRPASASAATSTRAARAAHDRGLDRRDRARAPAGRASRAWPPSMRSGSGSAW